MFSNVNTWASCSSLFFFSRISFFSHPHILLNYIFNAETDFPHVVGSSDEPSLEGCFVEQTVTEGLQENSEKNRQGAPEPHHKAAQPKATPRSCVCPQQQMGRCFPPDCPHRLVLHIILVLSILITPPLPSFSRRKAPFPTSMKQGFQVSHVLCSVPSLDLNSGIFLLGRNSEFFHLSVSPDPT